MSIYSPLLFVKATDPISPGTLSGTSGALTNILNSVLILKNVFTTTDDVGFTDNTVEARLLGGTSFKLFITPATGDRAYISQSVKFGRVGFKFGTFGTTATYVWEYWNGSTWVALTVSDGTLAFTQDGTVFWTPPADWASNTVNSVAAFYVRVRFTGSAPATNPLVNSMTITGWNQRFSGTNQFDYKQGGGNGFVVDINDNAITSGQESNARGFESVSSLGSGTGLFPTVAQIAAGIFIRKSVTADATARDYIVLADDRTFYFFALSEVAAGVAGSYYAFMFGDIKSQVPSDGFRTQIAGRAVTGGAGSSENLDQVRTTSLSALTGHYIPRPYTGLGSSLQNTKTGDPSLSGGATTLNGNTQFPNGADGGLYLAPVRVIDPAGPTVRGRLRGFWQFLHTIANVADKDTVSGVGDLVGKTFMVIKQTGNSAVYVVETSDTWETD